MVFILVAGQSNGNGLFQWAATETPHPDTHMWNGSALVAPTGAGSIAYCNYMRAALNEPIYVVNACVDGMPLLGGWNLSGAGSAVANAIAKAQAAMVAIPGCAGVDRIEFIGCNSDCIWPAQSDMYNGILNGLAALRGNLCAGLGDDFTLCIWPVGSASAGSMAQVVRAQIVYATTTPGVEVGPGSYERLFGDGNHWLNAVQAAEMGRRGGVNAVSSLQGKAASLTGHLGAGPRIVSIHRNGNAPRVLVTLATDAGLKTNNPWGTTSNWVSGFGLWWREGSMAQLNVIDVRLLGTQIAIDVDRTLDWTVGVGNQWERGIPIGYSLYDMRGLPLVQHTMEMLQSN